MTLTVQPLLAIGTFGTHVIEHNGVFSFAGTVPRDIKRGGYPSERSAISAFAAWFCAQGDEFINGHIDNLRDDVLDHVLFPNKGA